MKSKKKLTQFNPIKSINSIWNFTPAGKIKTNQSTNNLIREENSIYVFKVFCNPKETSLSNFIKRN